jgi:hypothetical protein
VSNEDNNPIRVTAEEHQHPALRILARACLAIARDQLEREGQTDTEEKPQDMQEPVPGEAKEDTE